ncbi:universal stress protein [Polynucleobacter sp. UB-Siik-W21]|nr:universal stress protein [Polynucleobacter sp. UB-Siik-W21]
MHPRFFGYRLKKLSVDEQALNLFLIWMRYGHRSEMIIMGAKGRSSVSDIVLGSVSQRVSVLAKQAVLLVK